MLAALHRLMLVVVVLFPAVALASSPCQRMSKEEYRNTILDKTPIIAHVKVADYSHSTTNDSYKWTTFSIIRVLRGPLHGDSVKVVDFQAVDAPLYTYDKGTEMVLFLLRSDQGHVMFDMNWKRCTPSIVVVSDGKALVPYESQENPPFSQFLADVAASKFRWP